MQWQSEWVSRDSVYTYSIEAKEEARMELKSLVDEFLENGGVIKSYGVTKNETISRKEICKKYGVTDKQIRTWAKENKFPAMLTLASAIKSERQDEVRRAKDLFLKREVETFFDKELYKSVGYSRSIALSSDMRGDYKGLYKGMY